jgi:hypothetical protein
MATIGIKIANGNFYPLLDENARQKKEFVLIPARKGQKVAQINFYKSESRIMEDAQYIGGLSIGNREIEMDEDTAIALTIVSNGQGEISVAVKNTKTDEFQQLAIALEAFEPAGKHKIFDEDTGKTDYGDSGIVPLEFLYEQKYSKKPPLLPIAAAVAALAVLGGLLCFFVLRGKGKTAKIPEIAAVETVETKEKSVLVPAAEQPSGKTDAAPPAGQEEPPVEQAAAESADEEERIPAIETISDAETAPVFVREAAAALPAGEKPEKMPAPVRSYKIPRPIPGNGATYRVRWGDTLWDIADVFYNNAWLYRRLAKYNKLRPSAILLPGTVIRIPQKL